MFLLCRPISTNCGDVCANAAQRLKSRSNGGWRQRRERWNYGGIIVTRLLEVELKESCRNFSRSWLQEVILAGVWYLRGLLGPINNQEVTACSNADSRIS